MRDRVYVVTGGSRGLGFAVVNCDMAPFPATTSGDAQFKGKVDLPSPCVATIVFVTTGTGDPPAGSRS